MGSWGTGAFDNDTAHDWVNELDGATDLSSIDDAFDVVLHAQEAGPALEHRVRSGESARGDERRFHAGRCGAPRDVRLGVGAEGGL